jgi:hypothetical protein
MAAVSYINLFYCLLRKYKSKQHALAQTTSFLLVPFTIATVDLSCGQFWQPPSNPLPCLPYAHKTGKSSLTISSCDQPAPLNIQEIGRGNNQRKLAVSDGQHQRQKEDSVDRAHGTMKEDSGREPG